MPSPRTHGRQTDKTANNWLNYRIRIRNPPPEDQRTI
jgi:hypothetical protein